MAETAPRAWWIEALPAPGAWPFQPAGSGGARAWLERHALVGRRLGLIAPNLPAMAQLIAAAARAGTTLVLFNRRLLPSELAAQIAGSALDACAVADGVDGPGTSPRLALPDCFTGEDDCPPHADRTAGLVVFTSGTSGPPKAARLPWATLRRAAEDACTHLALGRDDAWLACLPLDHIGGASIVLRAAVVGCRVRLRERFAADAVTSDLDGGEITGASLVPTMLHRLVAGRTRAWHPRLRTLLIGGGALAADLATCCAALGVRPAASYGLTEAASQVCTARPGDATADGGVGTPLPGVEVMIVDPDAAGDGVIAVRGGHLFAGYEAQGDLVAPHPPGAWFTTGDLGRMGPTGLSVLGRHDEIIISGGEKVAPDAIEAVLAQHPAVAAVAVCGLPDAEWGQVVVAGLVAHGEPPTDDAFAAWLGGRLAGFRRPRRWRWLSDLPRTALGKPRRLALASLFATSR